MKHLFNHSHFLKIAAFSIVAVIVITSTYSFTGSPTAEKYYKVAQVGQGITVANKAKLLSAFRAQYGKNASVSEIKLVEKNGATWLVFLGGGDGTPTVGIKLDVVAGYYSIDMGGPVSINNCQTQGNCSCCTTDCACSAKNGGQESCGSDACKSVKTDELLPSAFKSALGG